MTATRLFFLYIFAIALTLMTTSTVLAQEEDEELLPGPPVQVRVSLVGNAVQIRWEAPDENPEAVTGYEIVRGHAPSGPYKRIVRVPHNVLSYRDSTIRLRSRYFYKIRAEADGAYSDYSDPAFIESPEISGSR